MEKIWQQRSYCRAYREGAMALMAGKERERESGVGIIRGHLE